jgi:mRNA interferase RelE/StbE
LLYLNHGSDLYPHRDQGAEKGSSKRRQKIADYAAGGQQDVKALQGSEYFRLRHGNWRAIFSQDGVVLAVLNVAKRGEV